jgi:glucokinase
LERGVEGAAVGIDVGGTKIAAGVVDLATGRLRDRRQIATRAERGGAAVLADCARLANELGEGRLAVGIGLCELVDLSGRPASGDTVDWRGLDVAAAFGGLQVALESDVRAAARAEARFGAGAGRSPFLYVIAGSGVSVCLVLEEAPYAGAHGNALVLGAPPVETVASGRALQRLAGLERAEDVLAERRHADLVEAAATSLGQALAMLVNALDPSVIVLGGGLGGDPGFRGRVRAVVSAHVAYPVEPPLDLVGSTLGGDGGIIGAALSAAG